MAPELPVCSFRSRTARSTWLAKNHASSEGLWVRIAKRDSGIASVVYPEVLDVALCYGRTDGHRKAADDQYFLQRFTPRRARTKWSELNRARAMELIKRREMKSVGLREINRAKARGRWEAAYARRITTLEAMLAKHETLHP